MADLLAAVIFWAQWGVLILLGIAAICALGAAALWCWATAVRFDEADEE